MKALAILLVVLFVAGCTQREKGMPLEQGTPNYILAEKLAAKVPELDPEKNMVIATTSTFEVTVGDVVDKIRSRFGSQAETLDRQPLPQLKKVVMEMAESVAMSRLAVDEAHKLNLNVTDADVDTLLQQQYTKSGGEENFVNMITRRGITLEVVRRDMKESETIKRYVDKMKEREIIVSEDEVDAAFEGDKTASVRHILINTTHKSDSLKEEARVKIEDILKKARAGEDFAELAKQYSEDPGSKNDGGLYENFGHGKMVKPFEEAAFNVPVGEISDVVETQYGYHILQVVERKKEERPRDVVKEELLKNKSRNIVKDIYEELKESSGLSLAEIS